MPTVPVPTPLFVTLLVACTGGSTADSTDSATVKAIASGTTGPDTVDSADSALTGGVPTLTGGPEEVTSSQTGLSRPSIALDAAGQPHVVADLDNPRVYAYHRIGGSWSGGLFAEPDAVLDAGRIYLPHLEVDGDGRGWVSAWLGIKESGTMQGQAVWRVDGLETSPEATYLGLANSGTKNGNLAVDPSQPGTVVVMSKEGRWQRFDASGPTGDSGSFELGATGEKIRFLIHPDDGTWHGAMSGYSQEDSRYRSSDLPERITWAKHATYDTMGDDMLHPGLGLDGADPAVAYIGIAYAPGVVINVWDGQQLVFPPDALEVLDDAPASHGSGKERHGPEGTPCKGGGAWVCWTHSDNTIYVQHVAPDGTTGERTALAHGKTCAMATDAEGDVHLVYVDGTLRYRELAFSR